MARKVIQVDEKVSLLMGIPLSIQHLFAMFGASVLVPAIFGINPAIVLLMNGIGTLGYLIICKGKVPAFLGSSFAFIPPVLLVLGSDKALWAANYPFALGGFIATGLIFIIIALIIKFFGNNWLKIVFPPAVIGPIIALIGLGLAETAANMAGIVTTNGIYETKIIIVSMLTFFIAVFGSILFRRFLSVIPVLVAIVAGYLAAIALGVVDFSKIFEASLISMPNFSAPKFSINAIITIIPAVFVVISEHIGHFMLTQHIINRDIARDPGLHRSILGNGIFTVLAGMFGSVPNTTYGENISVMAITRIYSVWVIGGAAILSIIIAFIGKITALIQSIPVPVMGGVSLFLFGVIAVAGIRYVVEEKVDYSKTMNLVLSSVVFIIGISGASFHIGTIHLKGVTLATLMGLILGIIFHFLEKLNLTNEVSNQTINYD
ncbi:MAG: uracil permease [Gammaproteobacteria bacterium]|nr:uracil permease [Gammaproteobacteria bacterium]